MAAPSKPAHLGDPCPDPSAHAGHRDPRLQDQASKAALLATNKEHQADPLGPDGKLSAASAAASLKYAKAHELPSFPSVGIDTATSGNKAATLGWNNTKSPEWWQPDLSSDASKAALLAHKDGGKLDLWQPSASENGLSAAGIAMGKQHGLSPQLDYGYTDEGHKRALLAATLSVSGRGRAGSTPVAAAAPRYPDAENSAANALNAATVAHRPSVRSTDEPMSDRANEMSRIKHLGDHITVNRDMFTEHPPVNVAAAEDPKRKAALGGATQAHSRNIRHQEELAAQRAAAPPDAKQQANSYINIQLAAQKLAAERLAKFDPDGIMAYREHYGYGIHDEPHGKVRRKSAGAHDDDAAQARKIRQQMSQLSRQVETSDEKKRTADRTSLMAAAEKAVQARMSLMDQQIFEQSGKITPGMMEQWEAKARAKAAADSEARLKTHGLTHIGGGKFMDDADINAIAAARVQPTLDEVTDTAEKRRARDEELRLLQEQRKREGEEKRREAEQDKQEEKTRKRLAKEEEKQLKEARKQQEKEWKREQKEAGAAAPKTTAAAAPTKPATETDEAEPEPKATEPATTTAAAGVGADGLTAGEVHAMQPSTEDPPGVPTTFDKDAVAETSHEKAPADAYTGTKEISAAPVAAPVITEPAVEESAPRAENSSEVADRVLAAPVAAESSAHEITSTSVPEPASKLEQDVSPTTAERPVASEITTQREATTAATATAVPDTSKSSSGGKTLTKDRSKRDSKVKSFFGKFNAKLKRPPGLPDAEGTPGSNDPEPTILSKEDHPEETFISVPGTHAAHGDATASKVDTVERGRVRESVQSHEEFEEAKDKFDDDTLKAPEAPKAAKDESPARPLSKFQEAL